MDDRKRRVLEALIDDYIQTGEPVGSRVLVRRHHFGVSPATIRNEMADLAGLGYLEQLHTSSGRVPSDKGYRFYVDELVKPRQVRDAAVFERIQQSYRNQVRSGQWLIHQTARLVAEMTGYPAVVYGQRAEAGNFYDLNFIPLAERLAILVLRSDRGVVETRTVQVPEDLDRSELAQVAEELSQRYRGTGLAELAERMREDLRGDLRRFQSFLQTTLEWLERSAEEERVAKSGTLKILDYPEFRDVHKVQRVLGFLEQETLVEELGETLADDQLTVRIGGEMAEVEGGADLTDCSVVAAGFHTEDGIAGKVMVVGPRRMRYDTVMGVLETIARELSRQRWA